MKPSTAVLIDVLLRHAKGIVKALERWFEAAKAEQTK